MKKSAVNIKSDTIIFNSLKQKFINIKYIILILTIKDKNVLS